MRRALLSRPKYFQSRLAPNLSLPRHFSTSSYLTIIKPINLSDIGEGTRDVEILKYFVSQGDSIKAWDDVVEVQSDKSTVTIQAGPKDGTVVKIHWKAGDTVKVGKALIDLEYEGSDEDEESSSSSSSSDEEPEVKILATPAIKKLAQELKVDLTNLKGSGRNNRITKEDVKNAAKSSSSATGTAGQASAAASGGKVLTTPPVRKFAKENDIDLSLVPGTGPQGRITIEDVTNYIAFASAPAADPVAASPATTAAATPIQYKPVDISGLAEPVTKKLSAIQKAMVKTMKVANEIPHFGYSEEYDLSQLVETRALLKDGVKKDYGLSLSYMPFIIKAVSMALHEYPMLNASVNAEETEMTYHSRHNIGVAVDTPHGLLVPNVKDCQGRSILDITNELTRLVNAGRDNKLGPADLADGTFALSNIGAIGGTYAKPVILPPQVAIGALGKIQKLPRFGSDGQVVAAHVMVGSWSADHRVIEGAQMARFSNKLKYYLENPSSMLLSLK